MRRFQGLLLPLGPVEARRLFSGHGLYLEGVIFAIVWGEELLFRVDAESKPAFARAGGRCFSYQGKYGTVELPYWTAPSVAYASAAKLRPWAERALAAARRVAAAKAGRRAGASGSPLPRR